MIVTHKKISESKRARRLSLFAYNLLPMLMAWADHWGRGEWNERKIVAKLWPGHRAMLAGHVRKVLLEYARVGLIRPYKVDDAEFFEWQEPEYSTMPEKRRRWMHCPPPAWAPAADRERWTRGCGKPRPEGSLDLPFDDLAPTSPRPLSRPPDTGHQLPGNPAALSVLSVTTTTDSPPHPPLARGEPGALAPPTVPMVEALRLEFERRARDELRGAKRRIDHQAEQARQFALDSRIGLRADSLRCFRRWFRQGATLAQVQRAIEDGEHLAQRDGGRPEVAISKHVGAAEARLLARAPAGKARPPPPANRRLMRFRCFPDVCSREEVKPWR